MYMNEKEKCLSLIQIHGCCCFFWFKNKKNQILHWWVQYPPWDLSSVMELFMFHCPPPPPHPQKTTTTTTTTQDRYSCWKNNITSTWDSKGLLPFTTSLVRSHVFFVQKTPIKNSETHMASVLTSGENVRKSNWPLMRRGEKKCRKNSKQNVLAKTRRGHGHKTFHLFQQNFSSSQTT